MVSRKKGKKKRKPIIEDVDETQLKAKSGSGGSPGDVLIAVSELLDVYPPREEEALKLLKDAYTCFPEDDDIRVRLGELFCTLDRLGLRNQELGVELLMKSVQTSPLGRAHRYMNIAQVLASTGADGLKAATWFSEGAKQLAAEIEQLKASDAPAPEKEQEIILLTGDLARAYCAIAELYMTELCDDPDAEKQVKLALEKAIRIDPKCFDARVNLATYYKVIGSIDEARKQAEIAFVTLGFDANTDDKVSLHGNEEMPDHSEELPEWNARLSLAATAIDLGLFQQCHFVLNSLMEENGHDPQAWYLRMCCLFAEKNFEEARDVTNIFKEILDTGEQNLAASPKDADLQKVVSHWRDVVKEFEIHLNKAQTEQ